MGPTELAVKLTQQVKAGGCASKLAPGFLSAVLAQLPQQQDNNVLVSFNTADDAGVYRISRDLAIVQTVDFFTPMVDNPFTFGRIAATNALSDVYAMGGRALTALSIVCFPAEGDLKLLQQIMRGGLSVMQQAACIVLGGHSVRDNEIKFGYAVTGLIHPDRIFTNTGAQPGDALILTKPIGTGVITTALKRSLCRGDWLQAAIDSMTTSNGTASEIAARPEFEVHAITDVTGFSLIGHAREMAIGSNVRLTINSGQVPLLPGAIECVQAGCIPAGLLSNREFAECFVQADPAMNPALRQLFYDPQTSGGLLLSLSRSESANLLRELRAAGLEAACIGGVTEGNPHIRLNE